MSNEARRRNIKLVVAYDGTAYRGWQRQADGVPTVQAAIEAAAVRVVGHPISLNGAGRTDAGVHAAGQAANFLTTNLSIPLRALRGGLDARCPRDVAVLSAAEVPIDFHAARWALGKTYRYRIHTGSAKPALRARQVYHYPRALDPGRMRAAAARLLGAHDFRGFAASGEQRDNSVRTISSCRVSEQGDEVHVTVTGGGFLYKMVRNIVGTLIEIGRGRWGPERVDRVLASGDRREAGFTAPPGGLCLMSVQYPPAAPV